LGCGQFCTKPGLIVLLKGEKNADFLQQLVEKVNAATPQLMLNASTLEHYRHSVEKLAEHPTIRCLAGDDNHQAGRAETRLYQAQAANILEKDPLLQEEVFGPLAIVVEAADEAELLQVINALQGQLTATLQADEDDRQLAGRLLPLLADKAGRVLFNGYPTGVEVCDAMVHGGPFPATTDARGTSVGTLAITRFLRPVCLQNAPAALLPPALQDSNPLNLLRLVNGQWTREAIPSLLTH
jgi:alpha-ketoglutaric semialdehyde dehydrogenase